MPIFFYIDYQGAADMAIDAGMGRRGRVAAMQYANLQVARLFHRVKFPDRFKRNAKRRFRHQKRKRPYSRIKRELSSGREVTNQQGKVIIPAERVLKGGVVNVVRGGDTESKALNQRWFRSTVSGFTIRMSVPQYIVTRRRGGSPDMKRELSTITQQEAKALSKYWWRQYRKFIDANRVFNRVIVK